jgi:hypothetical protein
VTPGPGESCPRWQPSGWLVVLAAFLVGFANFPLRVVGTDLTHLPGDGGDNRLNNFVLEHGYRWLTGRAGVGFWDAPLFYPVRRVTAWSDAHLGMLPLYAAFRAAGASPEGAFQGHFLTAAVLNFVAAVWAMRRLGFGPFGAAAGAFVFAFGLPLVGRLPHAQLHPRFLVPPAVVFAWEFLRRPKAGRLAAVAVTLVGQLYLTVYIGYFLALLLAAGLVVTAVRFRRELDWPALLRPGRREWLKRTAVLAAAAPAGGWLLAQHARDIGVMDRSSVREAAPVPNSWLSAPPVAWLWPTLAGAGGLHPETDGEQLLHPGLFPLAALGFGLVVAVRPRRLGPSGPVVAVAALAAVLLLVLVTRWGIVWPYDLLARLPGVTGIRVVGRVGLVLLLPMGIALAGLIERAVAVAARGGRAIAALAGSALLGLVAADQWLTPFPEVPAGGAPVLRYPKAEAWSRQERIAAAARERLAAAATAAARERMAAAARERMAAAAARDGAGVAPVLYVFPSAAEPGESLVELQLQAMRASQDLGIPCVNGWSGYLPPGWGYFADYRSLLHWLTVTNPVPPETLDRLLVVGEPEPDHDPVYEAEMRVRFPPVPVARAGSRSWPRGRED